MLRIILGLLAVLITWAVVLVFQLPLWIAIAVTALALVIGAALFAWGRYKAKAAAGEIERTLKSQADAHASTIRPDQQAEIDAMQSEFQKAVSALKSSKLARGGNDALAVLPWYMIIGPPGAGKSTALRNSGLQFPYLSARGGGVKGVGGTRNCEWWLTNESVILDTAGRYTTEDEDRDEWTQFLDMLARTRSKKPINGLIVAVSVGDLGGESEESTAELARRIRERMDEVMSRLQVVLPAYLLFTKCDLIPGFVEIFSDLRKQDRGQIWGFTLPAERQQTPPGEVFAERFDELAEIIERRTLARLTEERNLATRERIFQFPQQFEALKTNLASFVEQLFAENIYQDTPLMRGVYFTSGTQEGRTIDRVMGAMAQAFGIRPRFGDGGAPVVEAKSYFLRDVFKQVIFPDQTLAVRSAKALRRDQLNRYGIAAVAVAAAIALFAFPMRSYVLNRSLVRSTGELVESTATILNAADGSNPRLDALEPLRERLELLMKFEEEGAPWSMRLGMYQGGQLLPSVLRLYATSVRRLVIQPVFTIEQEEMAEFARRHASTLSLPDEADYPAYYDRLKLHLLLSSPRAASEPRPSPLDQGWLADRIVERWIGGGGSSDGAAARSVRANAVLFARLMAEDGMLALPRHDETVKNMRQILGRLPFTSLAVNKLQREAEPKGLALTLPIILGEPVPVLQSKITVPGAFTRRGYEEVIKPRLDDPASVLEPWVLARIDSAEYDERLAEAAAQLRSRYFERYIEAWKRFLDDLRIDVSAAGGSLGGLQELTRSEPTAFERLFQAVAHNTRIGGLGAAAEKAGEGLFSKLGKKMGGKGKVVAAAASSAGDSFGREIGPSDVERAFAGLVAFAVPPDAASAMAAAAQPGPAPKRSLPLDLYLEQLTFVRDALRNARDGAGAGELMNATQTARIRITSLIDGAETGWRPRLQQLLWPPIAAATGATAIEGAKDAAQAWCADVAEPFQRTLARRYPFHRNGPDAAIADVTNFFNPNGLVWGFYERALRNDIERTGKGFRFARNLGGVSGFKPAVLGFLGNAQDVTTVLFPPGASEPNVQLSVKVRPTPGAAVVWVEIDGQKFDYRNGPEEWHRISWPAQGKNPGASIRVRAANGREEVVQQEGEWGLFRLIETGDAKPGASGRDVAVTWNLPSLGTSVTVDFRTARTDSPFFGVNRGKRSKRLMAPFRASLTPPSNIGKGGASCN